MEENIWTKIRREHGEYLIETLDPSELAYPLLQSRLISSRVHEVLLNPMTHRYQKNHELLIALQSTGQGGFEAFCGVLSKRPSWNGVVEKLTGRSRDVYHVPEYSGGVYRYGSSSGTFEATLETNSSKAGNQEGESGFIEQEVGYPTPVAGVTSRGHELARPSDDQKPKDGFVVSRQQNYHFDKLS